MQTRFNIYDNFEVKTINGNFVEVFSNQINIERLKCPIENKWYKLIAIEETIKLTFIQTFGTAKILTKNTREIEQVLQHIIIALKYNVNNFSIMK